MLHTIGYVLSSLTRLDCKRDVDERVRLSRLVRLCGCVVEVVYKLLCAAWTLEQELS